jgi:secreted Zn-dependent insulinase-like peptidase
VWARVLINTIDCGYTSDPSADAFFSLWANLFFQHLREVKYIATLGGHDFNIHNMEGSFGLEFHGYNQGYEDFYKQVFKEIKSFEPDVQYF